MEIFITGANGFIGSRLVSLLRDAGNRVYAAYRNLPKNYHEHDIAIGDMSKPIAWEKYLSNIDVVIHCAARVHQMQDSAANNSLYFSVNRDATIALAEAAKDTSVKRFIFLSTIKVNGEGKKGIALHPNDTPQPQGAYAESKYEAEQALLKLTTNSTMDTVIIRPTLVYGQGVKGNFASLIKLANLPVPLPLGGIENQRSFISVNNLCDLIQHCINEPKAANKILLASDCNAISTSELLTLMREANNQQRQLFSLPHWLWKLASKIPFLNKRVQRLTSSLFVDTQHLEEIDWQAPKTMREELSA